MKSLAKRLVDWLGGNHVNTPEGVCPNCWGRAEYGGKFYDAVRNDRISTLDGNQRLGWVQNYAEKHLGQLVLQHQDEKLVCGKCKVSYKTA